MLRARLQHLALDRRCERAPQQRFISTVYRLAAQPTSKVGSAEPLPRAVTPIARRPDRAPPLRSHAAAPIARCYISAFPASQAPPTTSPTTR